MNLLLKKVTNEQIPFISAALSADTGSWLWTFNASLPDSHTLNKLKPVRNLRGDYIDVSFTLGLQTWQLIIENADSNDTSNSFSISGRSATVLLAEPYSLPITHTWADITAAGIAQILCDSVGIALSWGVLDWHIDSYIAEKRYPIDIISELANDIGAIVQSLPNGTLAIVYDPVCSPNKIDDFAPDFSVTTDTNLFSRARKFVNNTNFNRVLITKEVPNSNANSPSVSIEEVVDGPDRLLNVFVTPFVDNITLTHASGANVALRYEGIFSQDNSDQLVFQDGKAQLSKPFSSLQSVSWHQDIIGQLAIDERGEVTADQGLGLATINYQSKYHRYRLSKLADIDLTLVAVNDIPTPNDISALSMELAIGDGDRVAPPLVVKTLSSLPVLKARGEAFLWSQLYDSDEYSCDCAYQNLPMLPAKIALIGIHNENLLFKGLIKSVSIAVDNVINQSVVIDRALK